jgi:hypothetical protein
MHTRAEREAERARQVDAPREAPPFVRRTIERLSLRDVDGHRPTRWFSAFWNNMNFVTLRARIAAARRPSRRNYRMRRAVPYVAAFPKRGEDMRYTLILLSIPLLAASPLAMARGGGGGGGGGGGDGHMSGPSSKSKAAANSNGRFATDRDKGLDRAADRRSAKGSAHEKATSKVKKRPTRTASRETSVFPPAPPAPPSPPLPGRPDLPGR